MSHGLLGRYAREVQPADTELTSAATNTSDDAQHANSGTSRQSPDVLWGLEGGQDELSALYNEPPSVNATVLQGRAVQVRDILSACSQNDFPTEHLNPRIFDRLVFQEHPKPLRDCIEQGNLVSTIFLLAVNNSALYSILRHVFPESLCTQYFQQKLKRRIDTQIQAFDLLDVTASGSNPPSQNDVQVQVVMVAAELDHIATIIEDDRRHRRQGETETAAHLVYMMQAVCLRDYSPGSRLGSGRELDNNRGSNLFQCLVGRASSHGAMFGLDALEGFSKVTMLKQGDELAVIGRLLVEHGAPQEYIFRFNEILGISVE